MEQEQQGKPITIAGWSNRCCEVCGVRQKTLYKYDNSKALFCSSNCWKNYCISDKELADAWSKERAKRRCTTGGQEK